MITMPLATVSVDLDNLWAYQRTHGDAAWLKLRSYLPIAVPRMLEAFERAGCRATVFIVGLDAAQAGAKELLSPIVRAGHEVGNHSFGHACWLHRGEPAALGEELRRADRAIREATGGTPVGFRGPGFTWSPALLETVANMGYRFDASLLPTFIGPLARWRLLRGAHLGKADRLLRGDLFGSWRDGLWPDRPWHWDLPGGGRLLEIPVTTMPGLRLPFHQSYLVYLASFSMRLARKYLGLSLRLCRRGGVEPSLLFHPLDWLGADEVPELRFFPGMQTPVARKLSLLETTLAMLKDAFLLDTMGAQADRLNAAAAAARQDFDATPGVPAAPRRWNAIPIRGVRR